jgi:hypothetical protein
MTAASKKRKRLRVGDVVQEKGADHYGIIVYAMTDESLVVVKWPPDNQGYVWHIDDLEKV